VAAGADAEFAVHLVTRDRALTERLKIYLLRRPGLRLTVSESLIPGIVCDVLVLPASALCEAACTAYPRIAYGSTRCLRASFLAGCSDYLREPWEPEELECRVFRMLRQRRDGHGAAWGCVVLRDMKVITAAGEADLSYPESLILNALLQNPGRVVPRAVLSYSVWGKQTPAGSRALDVHISALRKKLAPLVPEGRISSCRGVGYRLAGIPVDSASSIQEDSSSQTTAVP
jgi:DNA-binding winged helix-turn-helix (wHTH) protein